MRVWRVTDAAQLRELPVQDAWFDQRAVRHSLEERQVVVPFAQEGYEPGRSELVAESRRRRTLKVPLNACTLTIGEAEGCDGDRGWGDMGMLEDVTFDEARGEVVVRSSGELRVRVSRLDVRVVMTDEIGMYLERRVGKLLGVWGDRVWT
jgi:hypothetical protein